MEQQWDALREWLASNNLLIGLDMMHKWIRSESKFDKTVSITN